MAFHLELGGVAANYFRMIAAVQLFNQILIVGQTWTGSAATLGTILALLVLRRVLSREQRKHMRVPLFFLGLALVLGLSATAALKIGAYTVWGLLSFLDLLSLIVGITSLLSFVVFDLVLNRTRVRVPALVRDLIHVSILFLIVLTILYDTSLVKMFGPCTRPDTRFQDGHEEPSTFPV